MQRIPPSLGPFFQEYDIAKMDIQKDSFTIIERVLQFGSRLEIRWLFQSYSQSEIKQWVAQFGRDRLPQPHRVFWQLVLEMGE